MDGVMESTMRRVTSGDGSKTRMPTKMKRPYIFEDNFENTLFPNISHPALCANLSQLHQDEVMITERRPALFFILSEVGQSTEFLVLC